MRPHIKCDKKDNYMPLQCTAVNETESEGGATPRPKKGGPMDCRCVDMNTGVTIEGSEVRVERGKKRPDCKPRGTHVM